MIPIGEASRTSRSYGSLTWYNYDKFSGKISVMESRHEQIPHCLPIGGRRVGRNHRRRPPARGYTTHKRIIYGRPHNVDK